MKKLFFAGMFLVILGCFFFVMYPDGNLGRVLLLVGVAIEILTVLVYVFKRSGSASE